MGWGRKSSGGGENAGGTDWDAKKANAGSKSDNYSVFGKGKSWGQPETSGGSGGALSDEESGADSSLQ